MYFKSKDFREEVIHKKMKKVNRKKNYNYKPHKKSDYESLESDSYEDWSL